MFLNGRGVERLTRRDELEFRKAAAYDSLAVQSAAAALSLVRTGVALVMGTEAMADHLADLADFHGLDPEALHAVLVMHEPILATDQGLAL